MADILIHSAVPSLFTHTESASNIMVNSSTEKPSQTNNKYNGHVSRLRNVFIEHTSPSSNNTNSSLKTTTTKPMNHNNRQDNVCNIPIECTNNSTNQSINSIKKHNENIPYTIVNRKFSNSEQHYDFPADAIEQLKKQQRDDNDTTNHLSNQQTTTTTTTRIIPSLLPPNVKRMDHLNTIFIKPTKIEKLLPKLIFQEDDNNNKQEQLKLIDNTTLNESDRSSSPLFYEKPGIPEIDYNDDDEDDDTILNRTRRVKFSTAPIRVYATYSSNEYDRKNADIDPFSASAEYELEKRIEKMDVFDIEIEKGPDGLGISVLGMGVGADNGLEKLGIFVKSLNPQGIIAKDGRIEVGDQIIEVNGQSLVGVTHAFATNALKTTSGLVKFIIGREKDIEKSEILNLIKRSLELDQEREKKSETFQQYHDAYYEQHFNDDEDENDNDEKMTNEYEIEILKKCYESLEKTLENTDKEKEQYQQLYQQTQNDIKEIQDKYSQAKILIKELQDRENELQELYQQQVELNEQKEKRINELIKKIEELEKIIASNLINNSSPDTTKSITSHSLDIPERIINRLHTNFNQQFNSTDRNTIATSTVQSPSISLDKISTYSQQDPSSFQIHSTSNKSSDQLDHDNDQNLLINKTSTRHFSSKHYSTPSLGENSNDFDSINTKNYTSSVQQTKLNEDSTDQDIKIKDWTPDQCIQWLTAQEMTSLIPLFLNRNINGEKLLLLDSTKMKAIGIKSSKDRDHLKLKIKELKHAELDRLREQLLSQTTFHRSVQTGGNRFRSSSLTKLKERKFFSSNTGK